MKSKNEPTGQLVKHALKFGRGKVRSERKEQNGKSLKQRVRAIMATKSEGPSADSTRLLIAAATRWLHNKRCNAAKPPQKIGRTNRIKKSGDSKKK
jgi:hypothetical protein